MGPHLHGQFLNVRRFSRRNQSRARTTPSKKRGHRRHQCSLKSSLSAKRLSDGNSTDGRLRLLGSPGQKKRAAAGPCLPGIPWWHFAVEVQRVQRWMAVANPLKDGVKAVSMV